MFYIYIWLCNYEKGKNRGTRSRIDRVPRVHRCIKKEKARNLIIFDKCISRLIIKILDVIFILQFLFFFFNGITFPKFLRLSVGIFAVASDISSFFFFSSFPFFILRDLNESGFYGFVDIQHAI